MCVCVCERLHGNGAIESMVLLPFSGFISFCWFCLCTDHTALALRFFPSCLYKLEMWIERMRNRVRRTSRYRMIEIEKKDNEAQKITNEKRVMLALIRMFYWNDAFMIYLIHFHVVYSTTIQYTRTLLTKILNRYFVVADASAVAAVVVVMLFKWNTEICFFSAESVQTIKSNYIIYETVRRILNKANWKIQWSQPAWKESWQYTPFESWKRQMHFKLRTERYNTAVHNELSFKMTYCILN